MLVLERPLVAEAQMPALDILNSVPLSHPKPTKQKKVWRPFGLCVQAPDVGQGFAQRKRKRAWHLETSPPPLVSG